MTMWNCLLVAHNAKFDLRMLRQECGKFDLCFEPEGLETCDTLAMSRMLLPDVESHRLSALVDSPWHRRRQQP